MLFTFPFRTIRCLMAEVLFQKKGLSGFLRWLGGVKVDRNSHDFAFLETCNEILAKKGVVGIYPEGRLPKEGEERPLPFGPSAAYLALSSGAPVVPVYTNGSYIKKKRAHVIIGKPISVSELVDDSLSEKENIEKISEYLRQRIIALGNELERQCNKSKKTKE